MPVLGPETEIIMYRGAAREVNKSLAGTQSTYAILFCDAEYRDDSIQHIRRILSSPEIPEHFIFQAAPWRYFLPERPNETWGNLCRYAIPDPADRVASSDCQAFRTDDALAIGGLNENILDADLRAYEFHERMRLYCFWKNGNNKGEVLTRNVPIVVRRLPRERFTSEELSILSHSLNRFIASADVAHLNWKEAA